MIAWTQRSLSARRALGVAGLCFFTACGGIAVFGDDGPAGGAGGAGASTTGSGINGTKCVTGKCGDVCTRCEGTDCKAGRCNDSLECVVGSVPTCD